MEMQATWHGQNQSIENETLEELPSRKEDTNFIESTEAGIPSKFSDIMASRLSKSHLDYLLQRHGTLEIDPLPSIDPAEPYNWPEWKVCFPNPSQIPMAETIRAFLLRDR